MVRPFVVVACFAFAASSAPALAQKLGNKTGSDCHLMGGVAASAVTSEKDPDPVRPCYARYELDPNAPPPAAPSATPAPRAAAQPSAAPQAQPKGRCPDGSAPRGTRDAWCPAY